MSAIPDFLKRSGADSSKFNVQQLRIGRNPTLLSNIYLTNTLLANYKKAVKNRQINAK
ncbi:hypothetical protein CYANOKiyG1_04830 [Okeania sp. KiyG1]|nr:hypothetical protein CYANOKiyG1_04830 [Okeania sp. KiyG1]